MKKKNEIGTREDKASETQSIVNLIAFLFAVAGFGIALLQSVIANSF